MKIMMMMTLTQVMLIKIYRVFQIFIIFSQIRIITKEKKKYLFIMENIILYDLSKKVSLKELKDHAI